MIDWKEGSVCFGNSRQWPVECIDLFGAIGGVGAFGDFQLNEIRQGDYIEASELDTEQKYNDAVEVFELFWVGFSPCSVSAYSNLGNDGSLVCCEDGLWQTCSNRFGKRKITYPQLMAIGKLKRAMIEREKSPLDVSGFNTVEQSREKRARRNKSKQAYDILKTLDYEYDLVKQRWYKKAYV